MRKIRKRQVVAALAAAVESARAVADRILRWIVAWRVSLVRVDIHAKCPACGWRKGRAIQYSFELRCIVHSCAVCSAMWYEATVAHADLWSPALEDKGRTDETQANRSAGK